MNITININVACSSSDECENPNLPSDSVESKPEPETVPQSEATCPTLPTSEEN